MPAMNLGDREAADLAHFLLRETRVSAPLEVTQFRSRIESLEDLDSAELFRTGPSTRVSLGPMGDDRRGALRFSGWFEARQAGDYGFRPGLTASATSFVPTGSPPHRSV